MSWDPDLSTDIWLAHTSITSNPVDIRAQCVFVVWKIRLSYWPVWNLTISNLSSCQMNVLDLVAYNLKHVGRVVCNTPTVFICSLRAQINSTGNYVCKDLMRRCGKTKPNQSGFLHAKALKNSNCFRWHLILLGQWSCAVMQNNSPSIVFIWKTCLFISVIWAIQKVFSGLSLRDRKSVV